MWYCRRHKIRWHENHYALFIFFFAARIHETVHQIIAHVTGLQYFVGKPRSSRSAATRCGSVAYSAGKYCELNSTQCCRTRFRRSTRLCGGSCLSLFMIRPHTVSMTFMSGLCGGHVLCWKGCLSSQAILCLAVWAGHCLVGRQTPDSAAEIWFQQMATSAAARCRYTCFCSLFPGLRQGGHAVHSSSLACLRTGCRHTGAQRLGFSRQTIVLLLH